MITLKKHIMNGQCTVVTIQTFHHRAMAGLTIFNEFSEARSSYWAVNNPQQFALKYSSFICEGDNSALDRLGLSIGLLVRDQHFVDQKVFVLAVVRAGVHGNSDTIQYRKVSQGVP